MRFRTIIFLGSICLCQLLTWPILAEAQDDPNVGKGVRFGCPAPKGTVLESSNCAGFGFGSGYLELGLGYYAPSMKGREIFGSLVPYGEVWRTADNAAPYFQTGTDIWIGDLKVPAGTYSLFTLPSPDGWQLIVSKQAAQWGSDYDERQDLGRVKMATGPRPPYPVETLTIKLEDKAGHSHHARNLHIIWENTDVYVSIAPQHPLGSKTANQEATAIPR